MNLGKRCLLSAARIRHGASCPDVRIRQLALAVRLERKRDVLVLDWTQPRLPRRPGAVRCSLIVS